MYYGYSFVGWILIHCKGYLRNFREFICIIIASRLLNMLSTEPTDINPTPLTHILYAFADVQSDGTIILTDSYADEQVCKPSEADHI